MLCKKSHYYQSPHFREGNMRIFLRNKFPFVYKTIKKIYRNYRKKRLSNYFKTAYKKNALLSYILYPFTGKAYHFHTNYFEAPSWAKILHELGYNVDIVDYKYEGRIDFTKYDVLAGFGEPFQKYFKLGYTHAKTIYYGTGMEINYTNWISLRRLKDVYNKKNVWLFNSSRYTEKNRMPQIILADAIICLGNKICVNSYAKYTKVPIYCIPGLFFNIHNAHKIMQERNILKTRKSFLWFGGSGLVLKGLDLVLDFFLQHPDLKLHICGPIKEELDFEKAYYKELHQTPNIICHGFVDILSERFESILRNCSFIIYPSASEGGCPAVLTAIGNGALIPIITKETSISTGYEIWIEGLTVAAIEKAVNKALGLTERDILALQRGNLEYVLKNYTTDVYYQKLKNVCVKILEDDYEM